MLLPYCIVADVSAKNQQRNYSASTNPTETQVTGFIFDIDGEINLILKQAGYDPDSLYLVQSTVAAEIIAGSDVAVTVADGDNFAVGDLCKIEGYVDGDPTWEYQRLKSKSGDALTFATIDESYDAGSTISTAGNTIKWLRDLNATGAAWRAEEYAFMGISPNQSDHAEVLKDTYFGSEENCTGLWAIKNIPNFLEDVVDTGDQVVTRTQIQSYAEQHEGDADLEQMDLRETRF